MSIDARAQMDVSLEGERLKALDFGANRATAMGDDLGQYRIAHFATHGLFNSQRPELSGKAAQRIMHCRDQDRHRPFMFLWSGL
jgi:hypothetical protein